MSNDWPSTPSSSQRDARQAVLDGAVAGDVHDRRAVLQSSELVGSGERHAGVVRLVPERTVELGGVPDRLVNRQPEVAGVDHQVVPTRLNAGRLELLDQPCRQLGQLAGPVVPGSGEELPAPGRRAGPRCPSSRRRRCRESMATASNSGCSRTRCWVVTVPARSA